MTKISTTILTLDVATSTGWAFRDTDKHESAIENGAFNVGAGIPREIDGKEITKTERRRRLRKNLRSELEKLYEIYKPMVVCIEQPLSSLIDDSKDSRPHGKFNRRAPALAKWLVDSEGDGKDGGGGPNATTVFALNQLFATAETFFAEKGCYLMEVAPRSWQSLTANYPGKTTKDRSIAFCETIGITITGSNKIVRGDAADASVIAVWAEGRCKEKKLAQLAAQNDLFSGAAA